MSTWVFVKCLQTTLKILKHCKAGKKAPTKQMKHVFAIGVEIFCLLITPFLFIQLLMSNGPI